MNGSKKISLFGSVSQRNFEQLQGLVGQVKVNKMADFSGKFAGVNKS
jgi:hypothetical protein